jgi:[ribosomal protein S5]-alanine N-acetyltransferase
MGQPRRLAHIVDAAHGDGRMNAASSPLGRFLEGDELYLRALEERDVDGPYPAWLNDAEACAGNSHHTFPYTRARALDYVRATRGSDTELVLAVVLKDGNRHIGNIALSAIHLVYRSAQFSILLGDKSAWGKGYGAAAARLLLAHGFNALNLARIECGTFADNTGMRKLALALGMKEEGVRRKAAWKGGAFVDIIEFGILREEFLGSA